MYRSPPAPAPLAVVAINRHIVALERLTGRRAWVFDEEGAWRRIAITADRVIAVDASSVDGRMVCLAYATGAKLWEVTSKLNGGTILVDQDVVLRSGGGEIACHALEDGRLLWHDALKGMGIGAMGFGFPFNIADH